MPFYDYRCSECDHEVEVMHGINDSGPSTCERCGGAMRKALSAPAIHFKGSGWAKKDAQAATKAKTSKASGTNKSTGDKDSSKGDAKPPTDSKDSADSTTTSGSKSSGASDKTSTPASATTSTSAE